MPRTYRTFAKTLAALALRNAHALESKARAAASLAETYPAHAQDFRAIESAALRQLFRIMAGAPQTEPKTGVRSREARPSVRFAWRIIVITPEKEKI